MVIVMKNFKKCEELGIGLSEALALFSAVLSVAALVLSVIAFVKSSGVKKIVGDYDDYGYDDDYNWTIDDIEDFDVYLNDDDGKASDAEKDLKF
jgi:hypothetical protein